MVGCQRIEGGDLVGEVGGDGCDLMPQLVDVGAQGMVGLELEDWARLLPGKLIWWFFTRVSAIGQVCASCDT